MNNAQTINNLIMQCAEYKKDAEYLAGERDYWKQQANSTSDDRDTYTFKMRDGEDDVVITKEADSREKLEAEAHREAGYFYGRGFTNGTANAWNDDEVDSIANMMIALLDRQSAITRAECQKDSENVADWEDSCDTREILEYDCKWMAYAWAPAEYPDDKLEKKLYREIIEKLDRQKEITEREYFETKCHDCQDAHDRQTYKNIERYAKLKEKNVELQEQVDALETENAELKSRHCPHYHVKEHYCDVHETRIAELLAKVDALEAELSRTCTLAYDGKWLTCSNCGESLQWFGVRTVYKTDGKQERALGVEGVRFCPFCGARIEGGESE